ncbi:hypothetical protein [Roseobacter sinensis]|uniref:Glycosyltransferase 2-like domain-containing protein n=1 Tax=Roseobacter sinensis TaxID=2931391 RepID=A0ABT3BJW2_9RHOB|nr:hypothetical protein [Roseobacter sp. WL0113]MCV3273859.1 hypothetical protein [Roseobacter sp. WL0113]
MSKAKTKTPAITMVVTTGYKAEAAHMTLAAIAAQTIAEQIELLFWVQPGTDVAPVQHLLDAVGSYRVFDTEPIDTVDRCCARMALEARAPYVATIEDHAFTEPEWAETMIRTFEETGVDGVGSGMLNANPSTRLSWANFMLSYAQWAAANPEGPTDWISHHNGAFRLSALQRLTPDEVIDGSNREGDVVRLLKESGAQLYFQPACRIRHINPSSLDSTTRLRSDVGRLYGANRAKSEGWSPLRRAMYLGLGPAIPLLRYVRMRHDIFRQLPDVTERTHGVALFAGLVFDAAGQMMGYAAGPGGARDRLAGFEMDRAMHLTVDDKLRLYPASR